MNLGFVIGSVIPAKAGIQDLLKPIDSGFRGNDGRSEHSHT